MNTWSAPVWNARAARTGDRSLRIGLVNNMPDAAVSASERQFRHLLEAAACGRRVDVVLFQIPEIERARAARERMAARYRTVDDIGEAGLDALVVTGASPSAGPLRNAPFWPAFARLVETAATISLPTLWSCLAAHGAVEHLDGVARRRLAAKHTGVFAVTAACEHPCLTGVDAELQIPHSRWYDLAERDLVQHGYQVLTRSPTIGVDTFISAGAFPFLFWQGHPEYEADTLAWEYRRDLRRYEQGDLPIPPTVPTGLCAPDAQAAWAGRAAAAIAHGETRVPFLPKGQAAPWRGSGARLIGNWLNSVLSRQPAEFSPVQ